LNDIEFVQDDTLFKKTRELTRWQDLYYVYYSADNEMLWGIDSREKQLFGFVLDSVHSPNFKELTDSRLWALTGSPGGAVWVVGEQNLTRVVMKEMDYEWTNVPLNNKAETIATTRDGREVWLGNDCSGPSSSCWPLAWYADSAESVIQVELGGERKEVHDIEIDAQGIVWIGTERGLICYPKSDCDN
jgi:ligand-binding sensor domain-containing protein